MKSLNKLIFCWVACIAICSVSCKKYGFDIQDGYGVDSLVENITVDTSDSKPDFSMLSQARVFPGVVGASEPRIQDTTVVLNLNYLNESGNRLRISVIPMFATGPAFATGMYAPAGEPVIIDVPQGVNGLVCQIGMWTDNLTNKSPRQRAPVIYNVKQLFPGKNYVRNLFGGNIYINANFPIKDPVSITFSGACKSPDFILGKTDVLAWKDEIKMSQVPWFNFESRHIAFTLPTDKMVAFLSAHPNVDPIKELKAWDDIIKYDYEGWEGLSDTASNEIDRPVDVPWRVVLDIQPSAGYGHSGFPVVAQNDNEWFSAAMIASDTLSMWGTLHEIGHNNQQGSYWSWSTLGETTNNLFSFKRAHRLGIKNIGALHPAMPNAVTIGLAFAATDGVKQFDTDPLVDNPFIRIVPFLQIFDKAEKYDGKEDGWGFFPYLYWRARHAKYSSISDLEKHDFLYEALCEYTGLDYYKFFQAWGISLSTQARTDISNKYPVGLKFDIWNYNPITKQGGNNAVDYNVSRDSWLVSSLSPNDGQNNDQELSGEGANNGKFSELLDGNVNTYWHSRWSNSATLPPHVLLFDMTQKQTANGIYFVQRNNQRNAKTIKIWVGNDPNDLTLVTHPNAILQQIYTKQEIHFDSEMTFRYFKVEFDDAWDGTQFVAMAEIGLF